MKNRFLRIAKVSVSSLITHIQAYEKHNTLQEKTSRFIFYFILLFYLFIFLRCQFYRFAPKTHSANLSIYKRVYHSNNTASKSIYTVSDKLTFKSSDYHCPTKPAHSIAHRNRL